MTNRPFIAMAEVCWRLGCSHSRVRQLRNDPPSLAHLRVTGINQASYIFPTNYIRGLQQFLQQSAPRPKSLSVFNRCDRGQLLIAAAQAQLETAINAGYPDGLTVRQVTDMLGVGAATVTDWYQNGRLEAERSLSVMAPRVIVRIRPSALRKIISWQIPV